MGFDGREFFTSEINNYSLRDFQIADYKNDNLEYRKKVIEELLNQTQDESGRNFFETYNDNYYKVNLKAQDSLSGDINVHQKLELFADYLLNSKEIREERKEEKTKYYFYMNREEFKLRTKRELLINNIQSSNYNTNDNDVDNVIYFLLSRAKNVKMQKLQQVTNADLVEDNYCGQILREYNVIRDKVNYLLQYPEESSLKRYKLTAMKKSINDDMLLVKKNLKGIFGDKPKNLIQDSTVPSWYMFDFTNKEHVKKLLYLQKEFIPDDDVSLLLLDIDITIETLHNNNLITKHQYEIVRLIRTGYKNIEICDMKQIKKPRITAIVNAVVYKINKYYRDLANKS